MSPSMQRLLRSGLFFFVVFCAVTYFMQSGNDDFEINGWLTNAVIITLLYVCFIAVIRRITGGTGPDKP